MNLAITLRVDVNSPDNANHNSGALFLTDQTILCALGQETNPPVARWFRSTDGGAAWTEVTSSMGGLHNNNSFGCHFPENVAVAPSAELDFATCGIVRSINHGGSWNTVFQRNGPVTPPFRTVVCKQIISYERTKGIAVGQFGASAAGPWIHTITTADAGATWQDGVSIFRQNNGTWGTIIANLGGGSFVAMADTQTVDPDKNKVWKSTDHGATWAILSTLPVPSGTNFLKPYAITILTDQIWLISGLHNPSAVANIPALYRTTDAGATWTRISSSVIANWPADGNPVTIGEVKRITRDAAIMAARSDAAGSIPPWWMSNDQGATWDQITISGGAAIPSFANGVGAIVTSQSGKIILPLFAAAGGGAHLQIWTGEIEC